MDAAPFDVRIDAVGQIVEGRESERFVLVKEDHHKTGGYLIFTATDQAFTDEVFDSWVTDIAMVEQFFVEAQWTVRWLDS